ncbi:hypothetical protein FE904_14940 [Chryseobacterium indologenes]|uniref:hypothetical protein n=1 Tax=Chryseobacterium indologenes TaxID=253 RepID=UPI001109D474|nr:hypothetical protein [Chryseobacterium indologenes]TLX24666.1 hypothetical protein FE904_14940 [Chryseobacterium indologenes]
MEEIDDQELFDRLQYSLERMMVYSHTIDVIALLQNMMNKVHKSLKSLYLYTEPMNEDDVLDKIDNLKTEVFNDFSLTDALEKIFDGFDYAINENEDRIYFDVDRMLDIFSNYLLYKESDLIFKIKDPIYDFMYYFYDFGKEEEKEIAKGLITNFVVRLYGFILYRDYLRIIKYINPDFLISPNDNHIPIRIALLNSLNLINELNTTVPNKENIYRIIHSIVGGNEDNVKKYCLSLIGQNSTSQKQITKKHLDFAQKYINEKKL